MAETHVNFLGGSPLNRLSWLRSSTVFLSAVVASPGARWVIFRSGEPLVHAVSASRSRTLAALCTADVKSLLSPFPIFGQAKSPGEEAPHANDEGQPIPPLEGSRLHGPAVVFLGLHEPEGTESKSALPSSEFSAKTDPQLAAANVSGTPYFAVDVTETETSLVDGVLKSAEVTEEGVTLEFVEPRSATTGFSAFEAAIFAEARSMLDWNTRNKFCPACGSTTYSLWAGWKLGCSTTLPWADLTGRKPCPSAKGIHNFSHPRTDAVVIMAIIDESGEKILLGRNRKFPDGFYSTLAGFIEPGESFEDAVKREIWEEAGVRVHGVKYHSGQPWPYPASLMVGFYAFADASQPIRIDLDNELVDAKWCTRAEIRAILAHPHGARLSRKDYKKFDEDEDKIQAQKAAEKAANAASGHAALAHSDVSVDAFARTLAQTRVGQDEHAPPPFRVPPLTAIAGVLISDWANGKIGLGGSGAPQKGSL